MPWGKKQSMLIKAMGHDRPTHREVRELRLIQDAAEQDARALSTATEIHVKDGKPVTAYGAHRLGVKWPI